MKKVIITILALAAFSFGANAQFYAGGGINLGFDTETDSYSYTQLGISPEFGYMINDKMAVGASFSLANTAYKYESDDKSNNFNWSINPYFRYFFADFAGFKVFGDAILNLGQSTSSHYSTIAGKTIKSDPVFSWGISVAPGIAYDLGNSLTAVWHPASIFLQSSDGSNIFGLNILTSSSFGLFYNF